MEGRRIGTYLVGRKLGAGSLGTVYEAVPHGGDGGERFAIKFLKAQKDLGPQVLGRFYTGASTASSLPHPGIVRILDHGQLPDGTVYLVMELVPGEPLARRLHGHNGPLGLSVLPLFQQLAGALEVAHAHGFVHRDLTPQNVMLSPDPAMPGGARVRLLNFGMADLIEGSCGSLAQMVETDGAVLDTARYLAPEQWRDARPVSGKADVYSLGVMLYQCLSGRLPFTGDTTPQLKLQHLNDAPPPLPAVAPGTPQKVCALVHAMLAKDPRDRPEMGPVARELERLENVRPELPSGPPGRVGQLLGRWRVLREIGRGGMGQVFEVVHEDLERRAAAKVLHAEYSRDQKISQRFINEARAVNLVQNSGLVNIFDAGRLPDGAAYIVMEYLEGETLNARLYRAADRRGDPQLLRLVLRIAAALSAVHEKGIIHRDLKPENVMIIPHPDRPGDERIKVLDFGLAKLAEEHHGSMEKRFRTSAGAMLGTPIYMAPEQSMEARSVNDRADVYSLGVILYQVLTGRPPFVSKSVWQLIHMHVNSQPKPVWEIEPSTPRALATLVHRMLAKKPAERPSMKEVKSELWRLVLPGHRLTDEKRVDLVKREVSASRPLPSGSQAERAAAGTLVRDRRGLVLVALSAFVLSVGGGVAAIFWPERDAATSTQQNPPDRLPPQQPAPRQPPPPLPAPNDALRAQFEQAAQREAERTATAAEAARQPQRQAAAVVTTKRQRQKATPVAADGGAGPPDGGAPPPDQRAQEDSRKPAPDLSSTDVPDL